MSVIASSGMPADRCSRCRRVASRAPSHRRAVGARAGDSLRTLTGAEAASGTRRGDACSQRGPTMRQNAQPIAGRPRGRLEGTAEREAEVRQARGQELVVAAHDPEAFVVLVVIDADALGDLPRRADEAAQREPTRGAALEEDLA